MNGVKQIQHLRTKSRAGHKNLLLTVTVSSLKLYAIFLRLWNVNQNAGFGLVHFSISLNMLSTLLLFNRSLKFTEAGHNLSTNLMLHQSCFSLWKLCRGFTWFCAPMDELLLRVFENTANYYTGLKLVPKSIQHDN